MLRLALFFSLAAAAQLSAALRPIPRFPLGSDPLTITRPVEAYKPFAVAGERGAIFGEQSGKFEAWIYPVKILSGFGITAELADYPVPIDVSAHAAVIEVAPAMTTITYSHAAFTVKQHMFATRGDAAAIVVLFEIDSARPLRLTFRFKPEMLRMWPAPNFGAPNAEWIANGGYYVIHTDDPSFSAAIAMSRAEPGILPPYQERPHTYPTELKLSFEPTPDSGLFFPLIFTLGDARSATAKLSALDDSIPDLYRRTRDYYAHFFDTRLASETPDPEFDRALRAIRRGQGMAGSSDGMRCGHLTQSTVTAISN